MDRHQMLKKVEETIATYPDKSDWFKACQIMGLIEKEITQRIGEVGFELIFPPIPEQD